VGDLFPGIRQDFKVRSSIPAVHGGDSLFLEIAENAFWYFHAFTLLGICHL
jgi:hypothetical protein